jgi:GGDEF domain-containing protein
MALMSVKRYLTPLEEATAYRKVVSMLLDGVATNALNLDPEAFQRFRDQIGELRQEMASDTTVESLMSHAGKVVQVVGDYARETNGLLNGQLAEMHNMIATLVHAPTGPNGNDGPEGTPVSAMQSVSILKARLQESLDSVLEEAAQTKAEPGGVAQALKPEVLRKPGPAHGSDLDPITELPCEAAARTQFLAALHSGETRHVAVFVLESAQRINLRFGRATGDDVVRELKRYVASQLQPGDCMFRWPGPAIVALLSTTEPFDKVRARMKRFLDKSIERDFDVNGRSVLISLTIAWSVYPVSLPLAGLNRQIHDFIAGQGYRDEDLVPAR